MFLKDIAKKLVSSAPALAGLLGGPVGALAATTITKSLGLKSTDDLANLTPEQLIEAERMAHEIKLGEQELEKTEMEVNRDVAVAQIETNKKAAKSDSLFVAGPRPAALWMAVLGFFYHYLFQPIANGIVVLFGGPEGAFPQVGVGELSTLLFGLLGLGAMRTVEKSKGVARESLNLAPRKKRDWFKWMKRKGRKSLT